MQIKIARGDTYVYGGPVQPDQGQDASDISDELTTSIVDAAIFQVNDGTEYFDATDYAEIDATTRTILITLPDSITAALTLHPNPDLVLKLVYTTLGGAGESHHVGVPDVWSVVDRL